jgi:hypothetical protein
MLYFVSDNVYQEKVMVFCMHLNKLKTGNRKSESKNTPPFRRQKHCLPVPSTGMSYLYKPEKVNVKFAWLSVYTSRNVIKAAKEACQLGLFGC